MVNQTYFLGGVSPNGFYSKFIDKIKNRGFYTYILKGGPGTGKSTLMKKAAEAFDDQNVSLYYCSSDIRSLDAVVANDSRVIIVDGTAPHVFEALYPGASQEIINLGEFWDAKKLKKKSDDIHSLFDENLRYHSAVRCYIKALASLNGDIYSIGETALNREKLDGYTLRLCRKAIVSQKKDEKGKLSFDQLSAFTTENYKTMPINGDYSIYILKDDYLAGSDRFLRSVTENLISNGHDATVSECCLHHSPVYEHVFSGSAGIAFMTSSFFNKLEIPSASIINFSRFYEKKTVSNKKQRISFDKKAFTELAEEAANTLSDALKVHDELEKCYIEAIDFQKLDEFTKEMIDSIK